MLPVRRCSDEHDISAELAPEQSHARRPPLHRPEFCGLAGGAEERGYGRRVREAKGPPRLLCFGEILLPKKQLWSKAPGGSHACQMRDKGLEIGRELVRKRDRHSVRDPTRQTLVG